MTTELPSWHLSATNNWIIFTIGVLHPNLANLLPLSNDDLGDVMVIQKSEIPETNNKVTKTAQ